jgi:hypothetical protein
MSLERINKNKKREADWAKLFAFIPDDMNVGGDDGGGYTGGYGGVGLLTAHAGGGQALATGITYNSNVVVVCATAKDSIVLTAASLGAEIYIRNAGVASCDVFPALGDSINLLAVNLAVPIPVGATMKFTALNDTQWITDTVALTLTAPTTQRGYLRVHASDNAAEVEVTITNSSQAGNRTYTIPDAGGSSQFVLSPALDDKVANLHENLTIAEGFDVTITAEDTAGSITLDEQTFEVEGEGTATRLTKLVNLADAAATLSLSGTTCAINQDVRTTATPTFALVKATNGVGATGTSVTAVEYGDGANHVTVLTLTTKAYTIGDNASLGIGEIIYTLPAGAQMIEAAYVNVGFTADDAANAANTPEIGLGFTQAAGAVAVLSTAGWEDIFEGDAMANCTGTAYVLAKTPTAAVPLITQVGGSKAIYLNFAAAWSDNTVQTASASGQIVLKWTTLSFPV